MIRCDLHVHSDRSPDGRYPLDKLTAAAKKKGIDAIAICDHNICSPVPPSGDVLIIPGTEVSTSEGHILGLFLARPLDYEKLTANGLPGAKAAIDEIHSAGGLAVLAHPFERRNEDGSSLHDLDVDLIECANPRADTRRWDANEKALRLALDMGKPAVGGSDAHGTSELGCAYTEADEDVVSTESIKKALLSGRCRPVLERRCTEREKRLSGWAKARRTKKPLKMIKPLCALILSPAIDLAKGNKRCH